MRAARVFDITERELTLTTVEPVRQAFWIWVRSDRGGAVNASPGIDPGTVAVDLGRVELITTPGLGLLLEMRSAAAEVGLQLVLLRPSTMVRDVISRTQLDRLLQVQG